MKSFVLLALFGLASCRTIDTKTVDHRTHALVGGNKATDVTIYYTYVDSRGKTVDVEYEVDQLDLSRLQIPSDRAAQFKTAPAQPTTTPKQNPTFRTFKSPAPAAPAHKPAVRSSLSAGTSAVVKAATAVAATPSATPAASPLLQLISLPLSQVVQFVPMTTFAVQPSLVQLAAAPVSPAVPQPTAAAPKPAANPAVRAAPTAPAPAPAVAPKFAPAVATPKTLPAVAPKALAAPVTPAAVPSAPAAPTERPQAVRKALSAVVSSSEMDDDLDSDED